MNVYLVWGSSGEHDEHTEWMEAVFSEREAATEYSLLLGQVESEIAKAEESTPYPLTVDGHLLQLEDYEKYKEITDKWLRERTRAVVAVGCYERTGINIYPGASWRVEEVPVDTLLTYLKHGPG